MKGSKAILEVITWYTNNLDPNDHDHEAYITNLQKLLDAFGVAGYKAVLQYKATAKSNFFDYAHLMGCLKEQIALASGYLPVEKAWGILVQRLLPNYKHNANEILNNPVYIANPQLNATIESLGGWGYLTNLENNQLGFERKQFLTNYQNHLDKILTNEIIAKEMEINAPKQPKR